MKILVQESYQSNHHTLLIYAGPAGYEGRGALGTRKGYQFPIELEK